jgi:WD40 repeat protein
MPSRLGTKTVLKLVFAFVLIAMMVSAAYAPSVPYTLLWSDPVNVVDIAVSKDGRYVVVGSDSPIEGGQVRFYDRTSANPKVPIWSVPNPLDPTVHVYSVAISADGDSVAAGVSGSSGGPTGYGVAYWKNARTLTNPNPPTWTSGNLGGPIGSRALDMSDDGNYVVACGTGSSVYYWANAKAKSGLDVGTSWSSLFSPSVEAVDVSSDGDYVVAGVGTDVAYWKGARTSTGSQAPAWVSTEPNDAVVDVAVSDDGNYVAAAGGTDTVYYWAGAKTLTGNPTTSLTTWYGGIGVSFTSVDMSSDGNSVIAGASSGVYFWGGARTLTGKPQNPSWIYPTSTVSEVAIDDAGDYMVAANSVEPPHIIYFLDSSGNAKWTYQVDLHVNALSISSDGGTLAVGTEPLHTAYLFDTGFPIHVVGAPVGGFMEPVSKLVVFAPYLAVFGVIGAVAVVLWKRP